MAKLSIPLRKAIARSNLTERQLVAAIEGGILSVNEARERMTLPPAEEMTTDEQISSGRKYRRRDMKAES